jgi:N-acetylglucosamine-6-sulfatase
MYAHNHGVLFNDGRHGGEREFKQNGNEQLTIARRLQEAGYRTGLVGKYLNGFDGGGKPEGWDVFSPIHNQDYELRRGYVTDVLRDSAVKFVRSTPADQPLFLYFAPNAPHGPAIPAKRHRGAFAGRGVERDPSFGEADVSDKPKWARRLSGLSGREKDALDGLERHRLATLLAVDQAVVAIWRALEATGRVENTLVMILSDNGFLMGQHRMGGKQAPYDQVVRVPMLAYGPGFAAGTDGRLAANVDVAPTVADAAGVALPNADGRSLLQSWDRDVVLIEWFVTDRDVNNINMTPASAPPPYKALRSRDFLYVEWSTGEREYYDYRNDNDPYELNNLLADWQGHQPTLDPQEAQRLQARLAEVKDCEGAACP